ncbi:hypothetical protein Bcep1808_6542 [Burkholderia vietnamiensis G4]|uniref:Uncharacterized protein n=1 Tax=Burkholderia vietnamiensis (strain G4 / LMG 22486) TaxID=269482 RepID=A4JT34_BURVG|nr:hypothetical protein Bcep1808_6542 [Burkholderia vietnamiensis G4]
MGYVWDTNESCAYGAEPNSARVRAHDHGGSHSSRYLARPVGTARMVQQARYGRSTGLSASGCSWLQAFIGLHVFRWYGWNRPRRAAGFSANVCVRNTHEQFFSDPNDPPTL